ncbi:MAG TPA: DEAD/DEAH box helicase [Stellaceae bacterium]|nr:DEAD/DEAH box helicase [Stellaceae bacterium]
MKFNELGLSPELLRAVIDAGYTNPTPIQEQAIPIVAEGRDVLGCAQTGTGKTASFALPMIDRLAAGRARARMPRSLIIEPTRELATQVEASFEVYGRYHRLSTALLIGGESFADQEKKLDRGVDVLIATPGRLLDLFERGKILLSDVRILVIDEADRMLDMGFIPDVERIVGLLPKARQTLFFSATMPPEIRGLADAFLKTPVEIAVAPPASPAATVVQSLAIVAPEDKREALRRLIASEDVKNALIFCNRKRDVDILQRSLSRHGLDAAALHGDMSQPKRTETLERFKNGEVRLLVASDVAARGLDIQGLSHVFNFDVPYHAEDYVHRIGRTGRAGREGRSFTLAAPEDGKNVAAIQKLIGKDIPLANVHGIADAELEFDEGARHRGGRRNAAAPRVNGKPAGGKRIGGERPERRAARPEPARETERPRHEPSSRREPPRRNGHDRPQAARGQDGHEAPVVGFGDDLPAFLRRAPRIAAEA